MENIQNTSANRLCSIVWGGWHQRTILHLNEIYDFLSAGKSKLDLSPEKLADYRKDLKIVSVERKNALLESIEIQTKDKIKIIFFEDGLYLLEKQDNLDIEKSEKELKDYFENKLKPAISYIFSLGAPTVKSILPKETAPVAAIFAVANPADLQIEEKYGKTKEIIQTGDWAIYESDDYIFSAAKPSLKATATELAGLQIFIYEFREQLHQYLNLHRKVWEDIAKIKNRKVIRGDEADEIRFQLDEFQKTSNLIISRSNQMDSYLKIRTAAVKSLGLEAAISSFFQFKMESLSDTLAYIQKVWQMTEDYLQTAINNIVEIKNQSASRGIQSLQFITSIGVISTIIGYLSKEELPQITGKGAIYFVLIIILTYLINYLITKIYRRRKYSIKIEK